MGGKLGWQSFLLTSHFCRAQTADLPCDECDKEQWGLEETIKIICFKENQNLSQIIEELKTLEVKIVSGENKCLYKVILIS